MFQNRIKIQPNLKLIKGNPDLTPLVDVLFLLLIFFILSSSFVQVSGIKVDLPETSRNVSRSVEKFVVTVDENSNLFFNDLPIKWEQLKVKFLEIGSKRNVERVGYTIIIRADRKTPFGTIAKLMGVAEQVHLNAVVATSPPTTEQGEVIFEDLE